MLTSLLLNEKGGEVCIEARSPPVSLAFIVQVTEETTVKWLIGPFHLIFAPPPLPPMEVPTNFPLKNLSKYQRHLHSCPL